MIAASASAEPSRRAIRAWLYAVAALVFAMVLVGGATRLTESGLSIVEWQLVTGTVPPLDAAQWQAEFEKYQTIPQYRELNGGMTLDEFKTIYWWEWTHRLLGRVAGVAFLLPFLWFIWRGRIEPYLRRRLWLVFALGALQGAVGWWMVASGLAERVRVSQYRLAFHLTLAAAIFVALLWTARNIARRDGVAAPARVRLTAKAILVAVLVQIYLGALVAGLHAGMIYNTWPLIDGTLVPDGARLFFNTPLWSNFFENALTVQFDHRMFAYALWAAAVLHAFDVMRNLKTSGAAASAFVLAGAITVQATLGVVTLLKVAPIELALAHQTMAMLVLLIVTLHAQGLSRGQVSVVVDAFYPRAQKS